MWRLVVAFLISVSGAGNASCWSGFFSHDNCCVVAAHGMGGNEKCWDGDFTFERCCMGKTDTDTIDYWQSRYKRYVSNPEDTDSWWFNRFTANFSDWRRDLLVDFFRLHGITSVLDLGCGRGDLARSVSPAVQRYVGLDVSEGAVELAKSRRDAAAWNLDFRAYDGVNFPAGIAPVDCGISLQVIYHLLEDSLFERYMELLFNISRRWVIIEGSNQDLKPLPKVRQMRYRRFTDWVEKHRPSWHLVKTVPFNSTLTNMSSFYFFVAMGITEPREGM